MSPSLYPAHCRERSAESCGSSHATPAFPSGRTGFSSRGSRHVLECSSAHWGPCMPSRVPGMTPAAGLAQRIGDSTSLRLLYLSNMLFRPECSSKGEPHSPFTRQVGGNADRPRCVFSGPERPLLSIDAGASRFGPVIFTDSLSERSRWIENTNFRNSWRITSNPEVSLAWCFQANALIQLQFGTSEWISTDKRPSVQECQ
jgi:hypothetical protein